MSIVLLPKVKNQLEEMERKLPDSKNRVNGLLAKGKIRKGCLLSLEIAAR
jgi:hypothetical protein